MSTITPATFDIEILSEYKGAKGFYIKTFLLDDTKNLRKWRVNDDAAVKRIIPTYLKPEYFGKTAPAIMRMDDFAHPEPKEGESMLVMQEPSRVGDMVDVGFDEATHRAWQVSRIDDKVAQDKILSGEVRYVSPSLRVVKEHYDADGTGVVDEGIGNHIALVKSPAYGVHKAQIKGICQDNHENCMAQLAHVQAAEKEKEEKETKSIFFHPCGGITINLSADHPISNVINYLAAHYPGMSQENILSRFAFAFGGKEIIKIFDKQAGTDLKSLENISRPELGIGQKNTEKQPLKPKKQEKQSNLNHKQAETTEPSEDGKCPSGYLKGDDGKCHLSASAYIANAEKEEKLTENQNANAQAAEIKELKDQVKGLKDFVASEVKTPLVKSVLNFQAQLGLIKKDADVEKLGKDLMQRSIDDLKQLNADYSALAKTTNPTDESEHTEKGVRFMLDPSNLNASTGNADDTNKLDVLKHLRSKF